MDHPDKMLWLLRVAYRRGYDEVIFAGFSLDDTAQAAIQARHGTLPESLLDQGLPHPKAGGKRAWGAEPWVRGSEHWLPEVQGIGLQASKLNASPPSR